MFCCCCWLCVVLLPDAEVTVCLSSLQHSMCLTAMTWQPCVCAMVLLLAVPASPLLHRSHLMFPRTSSSNHFPHTALTHNTRFQFDCVFLCYHCVVHVMVMQTWDILSAMYAIHSKQQQALLAAQQQQCVLSSQHLYAVSFEIQPKINHFDSTSRFRDFPNQTLSSDIMHSVW